MSYMQIIRRLFIIALVCQQSCTAHMQSGHEDYPEQSCNVRNHMSPGSEDAGAAGRACIENGAKTIIFPPGDYTVKSLVLTAGTHAFPLVAFWFHGSRDVTVRAYGAHFHIANSAQGSIGSSYVGWTGDAKNVKWSGGEFFGNRVGLSNDTMNNGMCFESVSNLVIEDVSFHGDFKNGSAICGVYGFGVKIRNIQAYNVAIGIDFAYNQDLDIEGSTFTGGDSLASMGISNSADIPTYKVGAVTDASGKAVDLRDGQANSFLYRNNTVSGFHSCMALDDVSGVRIIENHLSGCKFSKYNNTGILISRSQEALKQGHITKNILIQGNFITDNGNPNTASMGSGILLAASRGGIENVSILANAIYDNCGSAISSENPEEVSRAKIQYNNFVSRGGSCKQAIFPDEKKLSAMQLIDFSKSDNAIFQDAIATTFTPDELAQGAAWAGKEHDFFFAIRSATRPELMIDDAPSRCFNEAIGRNRSVVRNRSCRKVGHLASFLLSDFWNQARRPV